MHGRRGATRALGHTLEVSVIKAFQALGELHYLLRILLITHVKQYEFVGNFAIRINLFYLGGLGSWQATSLG